MVCIDVFLLFAAIKCLKLNQEGKNRVLRALHHKDHHYTKFIQPELVTLYSFGPEPSQTVLSLKLSNQRSKYPLLYLLLAFGVWTMSVSVLFLIIFFCSNGDIEGE